jgi:hypothetical protein
VTSWSARRSTGMNRSKLIPLALALTALAPTTAAIAAVKNPTSDAAMRKGIRDVARIEGHGAKVSKIAVTCPPVAKVGQQRACTGTFRLTLHGKTAIYQLTKRNHVLRISQGAIEYRVSSKAIKKAPGLPASTDLAGFLQ